MSLLAPRTVSLSVDSLFAAALAVRLLIVMLFVTRCHCRNIGVLKNKVATFTSERSFTHLCVK